MFFVLPQFRAVPRNPDPAGTAAAPEQAAAQPAAAPMADTAPAADQLLRRPRPPPVRDDCRPSNGRKSKKSARRSKRLTRPPALLTVKGDDGSTANFVVGPEVKNFPQIRVGDKVVVSYYRGIAAELQPKGTPLSKKVNQLDVASTCEAGHQARRQCRHRNARHGRDRESRHQGQHRHLQAPRWHVAHPAGGEPPRDRTSSPSSRRVTRSKCCTSRPWPSKFAPSSRVVLFLDAITHAGVLILRRVVRFQ